MMGDCSGGNGGAAKLGGPTAKTREREIRKGRMVLASLFILVRMGSSSSSRSNDDGASRSEGITAEAGQTTMEVREHRRRRRRRREHEKDKVIGTRGRTWIAPSRALRCSGS
jgi:hypothetical protein